VIAGRSALRRGVLSEAAARRQERLLAALGLPSAGRALAGVSARNVFDAMQLDKKRSAGKLRFVLTHGVGVVSFGHLVKRAEVLAALQDAGCDP